MTASSLVLGVLVVSAFVFVPSSGEAGGGDNFDLEVPWHYPSANEQGVPTDTLIWVIGNCHVSVEVDGVALRPVRDGLEGQAHFVRWFPPTLEPDTCYTVTVRGVEFSSGENPPYSWDFCTGTTTETAAPRVTEIDAHKDPQRNNPQEADILFANTWFDVGSPQMVEYVARPKGFVWQIEPKGTFWPGQVGNPKRVGFDVDGCVRLRTFNRKGDHILGPEYCPESACSTTSPTVPAKPAPLSLMGLLIFASWSVRRVCKTTA